MEKDFHREFYKCPQCGSEDRFLEQLAGEVRERGLAEKDWKFHFQIVEGVVVDQTKAAAIPIGSELPGFGIMTDICMDCGCIYAVDLTRIDKKRSLPPAQIIPPNRSQRRRDAREQGPQIIIGNN